MRLPFLRQLQDARPPRPRFRRPCANLSPLRTARVPPGARRAVLPAAVLLAAFLLSFAADLTQSAPDGWPQFRGSPQLTGVSAATLPENLKLLWTFDLEEAIESSAAIAGDVVYVGAHSGELVALDLESGRLRWRYSAGNPIGESSPAVAEGRVYVGDLAGVVHAVRASDGQKVWTYETGAEVKASPVVTEETVLVGSYDGYLYGLAAETGELRWRAETQGPVHATAALLDGVTFVAGCDEYFRAIRVSDGQEIYAILAGAYTGASPAVTETHAYFGTFNNQVLALDLKERELAWRYEHPSRSFPFYSSAALADGRVVVGGRDRMVHCLDADAGEALWTFSTRARVESSPAVAGGRVYVGSNDGRLYVLDLKGGEKLWEFNAGAALSASPALASGRLVIGSNDGRVYCFG